MAFTAAEKAAIREALGYPGVTVSPFFVLEGRMEAADAETQTRCRTLLTQIAAIDTTIATIGATDSRFEAVEDVKFAKGGMGAASAANTRAWIISKLSLNLGVPVNTNPNLGAAAPTSAYGPAWTRG